MKKILSILLMISIFSCQKQEDKKIDKTKSDVVLLDDKLQSNLEEQQDAKTLIIALSKKRDSLLNVIKTTQESLSRVNENKIDKGIAGVHKKLNELKGQKENFEEQINLQKKEIDLANKKIEILNQENKVYEDQRKALWDKGAAPGEFVGVDSLLNDIKIKQQIQKKKVKTLNRIVADVEEQITSINEQRNFLSTKIRENYTAQEIFTEYAKEEENKINDQIAAIDKELQRLTGKVNALNSELANLSGEKDKKEGTLASHETDKKDWQKTKNRLYIVVITLVVLAAIFYGFYRLGKNKKEKKTK